MICYFDLFSGISGDMTLGALVDAGVPFDGLAAALARLPVSGYRLSHEKITSKGLAGTRVDVTLAPDAPQPHRHLSDVLSIINGADFSGLPDTGLRFSPESVKAKAGAIFRRLAEAEARVHGTSVESVHFHEVGAVDAIVDIVGSVIGLEHLGVSEPGHLFCSSLPTGSGTVETAHGTLPIPAPATLALIEAVGAPLRPSNARAELVTPTGAAIVTTLGEFRLPPMRLRKVGIGFGRKELPWANCLRLWVGEETTGSDDQGGQTGRAFASSNAVAGSARADASASADTVQMIEANLDDTTPELLGGAMTKLLALGALDVFFTAIQMKKGRPGVKLSVIASPERAASLSAEIIRQTTTLGVRVYSCQRLKAGRWSGQVETPWGEARIKVKEFEGRLFASPEYDDCLVLADKSARPLSEVYAAVTAAARAQGFESQDAGG